MTSDVNFNKIALSDVQDMAKAMAEKIMAFITNDIKAKDQKEIVALISACAIVTGLYVSATSNSKIDIKNNVDVLSDSIYQVALQNMITLDKLGDVKQLDKEKE
jgi:uncharacterized membrane protein